MLLLKVIHVSKSAPDIIYDIPFKDPDILN